MERALRCAARRAAEPLTLLEPAVTLTRRNMIASLTAIVLGALTRSATAPRLVLLIAWYGYLNWAGGH